jgi:hypothetical protein
MAVAVAANISSIKVKPRWRRVMSGARQWC